MRPAGAGSKAGARRPPALAGGERDSKGGGESERPCPTKAMLLREPYHRKSSGRNESALRRDFCCAKMLVTAHSRRGRTAAHFFTLHSYFLLSRSAPGVRGRGGPGGGKFAESQPPGPQGPTKSPGEKAWILPHFQRGKIQKIPIGVYPVYLMSTKNNPGTWCSAVAVKRFPLHVERPNVYLIENF